MPLKLVDGSESLVDIHSDIGCYNRGFYTHYGNSEKITLLILNLMPDKREAERQIFRLLSKSPSNIQVELLRLDNHNYKNTPLSHMLKFYKTFESIHKKKFDGMIITGAPLENIEFENITFWSQLVHIMKWARTNVSSIFFICWAVQAALKIFYNLPVKLRMEKISGIYSHRSLDPEDFLTRNLGKYFYAPHSRFAEYSQSVIRQYTDLYIQADSEEIGAYLFSSPDRRMVFVTGHPEYGSNTLEKEYKRDLAAGLKPYIPVNYFASINSRLLPKFDWLAHGEMLFSNWLCNCLDLRERR